MQSARLLCSQIPCALDLAVAKRTGNHLLYQTLYQLKNSFGAATWIVPNDKESLFRLCLHAPDPITPLQSDFQMGQDLRQETQVRQSHTQPARDRVERSE